MKKTIKNIASVAGIGIFSLFAIASVDDSTSGGTSSSTAKTIDTEPQYTITANKIADAFEENEVSANLQYENKIGIVTGRVDTISKDFGEYNLMLKTDNFLTAVVCRFDGDVSEQLAALQNGQQVEIKGMCDGMFGNVEFESCVIIAK